MARIIPLKQADYNGVGVVDDTESGGIGAVRVNVISGGSVPTGAATAAKQDTGNASLATIATELGPSTASTPASVAAADADTTLLAANTSRKSASIFNDADKAVYVKFGTGASSTSFKVKIAAGGFYELPLPIYTGIIKGRWETTPTGSARVAEET